MSCDKCKKKIEVLNADNTQDAFIEAEKTEWGNSGNNSKHICPECISKH